MAMKWFYMVLCVIGGVVFTACKQMPIKEVERISRPLEVLSSDLMSPMPGKLLAYDRELVWVDGGGDQSIHIVDRESGKERMVLALRGNGPEEVVTPGIAWAPDRELLIYDRNGSKQLLVSLDSLEDNKQGIRKIIELEKRFWGLSNLMLANGCTVFEQTEAEQPFILLSDTSSCQFGSFPLEGIEFDNRFEIYQGATAYNPYNGKLLHSIGQLSYVALFKWSDDRFVLAKDTTLSKVDYVCSGKQIVINHTPRYAPTAIAITKDYIVAIERDKESASSAGITSGSGAARPFSKAPHHVFVYDDFFRLVKIVDVGMPIFRIAADGISNRVFLIGVNPEFCIGTFELS